MAGKATFWRLYMAGNATFWRLASYLCEICINAVRELVPRVRRFATAQSRRAVPGVSAAYSAIISVLAPIWQCAWMMLPELKSGLVFLLLRLVVIACALYTVLEFAFSPFAVYLMLPLLKWLRKALCFLMKACRSTALDLRRRVSRGFSTP